MIDVHQGDGLQCPSILFRLCGSLYSIDSQYVTTIMELPSYQPLPDSPPYITGIFPYRGTSVTMFDLRSALKEHSLAHEFEQFCSMLDERKQDHIHWVETLAHSVENGDKFPLATDPHKCKLGIWFDNFKTESSELTSHLATLEEPHRLLHEVALRLEHCDEQQSLDDALNCKKALYDQVHDVYMPQVLSVLENAKEIFRLREYHEMVLVLGGETSLGIVVDEVLSVEMVQEEQQGAQQQLLTYSPYISRIVKSQNYPELILEVNVPAILHVGDELKEFPQHPAAINES